jgi:hypothetical protein
MSERLYAAEILFSRRLPVFLRVFSRFNFFCEMFSAICLIKLKSKNFDKTLNVFRNQVYADR